MRTARIADNGGCNAMCNQGAAFANTGNVTGSASMHRRADARHERAGMADDVAGEAMRGAGGLQRVAAG
jgi:hypothetical protein